MAFKSALRRGALAAIAAASAASLAACGAGQISQTANQVPAVDGTFNIMPEGTQGKPDPKGSLNFRDAHIMVNPDANTAGLKFTAVNAQRAKDSNYTIDSAKVDGAGDVKFTKVAETEAYKKAAQGSEGMVVPRDCIVVVDAPEAIAAVAKSAEKSDICAAYYSSEVDAATLVGDKTSAAGQTRKMSFEVIDATNAKTTYAGTGAVSAEIVSAGEVKRADDGSVKTK